MKWRHSESKKREQLLQQNQKQKSGEDDQRLSQSSSGDEFEDSEDNESIADDTDMKTENLS